MKKGGKKTAAAYPAPGRATTRAAGELHGPEPLWRFDGPFPRVWHRNEALGACLVGPRRIIHDVRSIILSFLELRLVVGPPDGRGLLPTNLPQTGGLVCAAPRSLKSSSRQ